MQDHLLNECLFRALLPQILLHGLTVTVIQIVAYQFEHVAADLAVDWKWHHISVITIIHVVNVGVVGGVVRDRILG